MDPDKQKSNDPNRLSILEKMFTIRSGQFRRLYRNASRISPRTSKMRIPQKEISRIEKEKFLEANKKVGISGVETSSNPLIEGAESDIDLILMRRRKLEKRKDCGDKLMKNIQEHSEPSGKMEMTAEDARAEILDRWVDQCYESLKTSKQLTKQDMKHLVEWDLQGTVTEGVRFIQQGFDSESGRLDKDLSSSDVLSSEGSEGDLKKRTFVKEDTHKRQQTHREKHLFIKEQDGVTSRLNEFYIQDLQEMKSLAYDEELYIFNSNGQICGSWRVKARICEDNERLVAVQFEGLLAQGHVDYCMFSSGIVDQCYCPVTELRVEQKTGYDGDNPAQKMFFHKKGKHWHFDLKRCLGKEETCCTLKVPQNQMKHVVSESAHILLMRKIVVYRNPENFGVDSHSVHKDGHNKSFVTRKKFVLKMKSISIQGQICRTNYRFYPPTRVRFHQREVEIVRVRRRIESPGQLVQSSNFYLTTAGQLVAVTFNDPYPHETPYYFQIDPKAVLDPARVISPERLVPLRERYMYDPELKQYYQQEVARLESLNKKWIQNYPGLRSALNCVIMELLADKPHRVMEYSRGYLANVLNLEGIKDCKLKDINS